MDVAEPLQETIGGWIIQRWPHRFAEKWIAFPARVVSPDEPWPGTRYFPSKEAAVYFCRNWSEKE